MVLLNDNHPFELDEFVKILRKLDFEKIRNMLKSSLNYTVKEWRGIEKR